MSVERIYPVLVRKLVAYRYLLLDQEKREDIICGISVDNLFECSVAQAPGFCLEFYRFGSIVT